MNTPPLVSASPPGTPLANAGVLGTPGATVLFGGNNDLLNDSRWGFRFSGGGWLDESKQIALEADYLGLRDLSQTFRASSFGTDIISRPFFNALTNVPDAELVSFPNVLAGTVTVSANSEFQSAGARLRWNMGCEDLGCGDVFRWHLLTGYRFAELEESLVIREQLLSLQPGNGTFDLHDRFRAQNEFHGGEIGSVWRVRRDRWDCELLAKLALGNVQQTVTISGDTQTDDGLGAPQILPGGLLAQRTNSGTFRRNRFATVPELGATVGYRVGRGWSASLGYSVIFWRNVVRPGDQIDPVVNTNLIPPETVPFSGPLRPAFGFRETAFWAQGINFGLNYRW
jgi:hypothetical protein